MTDISALWGKSETELLMLVGLAAGGGTIEHSLVVQSFVSTNSRSSVSADDLAALADGSVALGDAIVSTTLDKAKAILCAVYKTVSGAIDSSTASQIIGTIISTVVAVTGIWADVAKLALTVIFKFADKYLKGLCG